MAGTRTWILMVLLFGCVSCTCEEVDQGDREVERPDAGAPVKPTLEGALAVVNGIPVTQEEYLLKIEPYADRMKESLQGREYILSTLIDQILLQQEAGRIGLDQDPDYRRKVDNYRISLLNNMLLQKLGEQGSYEVTPREAREYYDKHPEEFDHPDLVHVRHILLAGEPEAKKVRKQIRSGASFERLVGEISQDPATRDRGGDLGSFSREQQPELADAAFSLKKPGDVSGPIRTRRGFHLLQLIERIPAKQESFEQVQESLDSRLRSRKRQEAKQDLLKKLRLSARIEIDKQALEALEVPAGGT